ncbi:MAG: choice-of-anchor Q domain-containing protein, partial [Candidatus Diapherotrites archaeon]
GYTGILNCTPSCTFNTSLCIAPCVPSCLNKQCGSDGCGTNNNCGTCSLSHASSYCNSIFQCAISSCNTGYANCDLNVSNGCETILGTFEHCSNCNACSIGQTCTNNVCIQSYPGTIYYVATNGNNNNAGTSESTPWKTLSKVNSQTFSAGDAILFKRGDIWYETLSVSSSGSSSAPITYGAYGSGEKPIITARGSLSGWNVVGNWNNEGNNRWSISYNGNYRIRVWVSGVEARRAHYTTDISSTYRYYYSTDSGDATPVNRLWIYSSTNPATTFSNIELSGARSNALHFDGKDYVKFQNIDFRGGGGGGWDCIDISNSDYIVFEYCNIGRDAGCYGLKAEHSNYWEVSNCTFDTGDNFHDYYQSETSEDGLSMYQGINYWDVHHNTFIAWGHTALGLNGRTGAASNYNLIHHNYFTGEDVDYGRAIGIDGIPGSMVGNEIYNNYCYDFGVNIQLNSPGLKFYNNIINTVRGYNTVSHNYITGAGIVVAGYEGYSATNMEIYNNVIANCRDGGIYIKASHTSIIQNNKFVNNILFNNGYNHVWGLDYYQIVMEDDDAYNDNILNQIFQNNLLYYAGQTDLVYYGHDGSNDYPHTVAEFNAEDGTEGDIISNNIVGDPLFVDAANGDFHLLPGSPAINKGISIPEVIADYDGNVRGNPPEVGAYEYQ